MVPTWYKRLFFLLLAALSVSCASQPPEIRPRADAGRDLPLRSGDDVVTGADSGEDAAEGPVDRLLSLQLELADGPCVDVGQTDRVGPAVNFVATGRPLETVELWAAKPLCGADAFVYQSIELNESGRGTFALEISGARGCDDNLLGTWEVWLVDQAQSTVRLELAFSNTSCAGVSSCSAAVEFCPSPAPAGPRLAKDQVFVLSGAERAVFTPPGPGWLDWRMRYEDFPLRALWEAFNEERGPGPMNENSGEPGWLLPTGTGSRNHGPLWMGESALGHAFQNNAARFDVAANKCLTLLDLDDLQGHMRDEAVGRYAGFWEGAVASMALAGLYAPEGSTRGEALLRKARAWWDDHVAVLRRLSVADGQVMLVGARIDGASGDTDSWHSLSAALNLQLLDPRPHGALHPHLASLITAASEPGPGTRGVAINWFRPRHVAQRWVVLRAVQSGAISAPPDLHPGPAALAQTIYRWEAGGRTHVATPEVRGLRPARWKMSWAPAEVVRIDVGETNAAAPSGVGRGPHPAPVPLGIPGATVPVLGR